MHNDETHDTVRIFFLPKKCKKKCEGFSLCRTQLNNASHSEAAPCISLYSCTGHLRSIWLSLTRVADMLRCMTTSTCSVQPRLSSRLRRCNRGSGFCSRSGETLSSIRRPCASRVPAPPEDPDIAEVLYTECVQYPSTHVNL